MAEASSAQLRRTVLRLLQPPRIGCRMHASIKATASRGWPTALLALCRMAPSGCAAWLLRALAEGLVACALHGWDAKLGWRVLAPHS